MSRRIILLLVMLLGLTSVWAEKEHRFTLVIDAGHGGKDPGAKGRKAWEKTINLNVALAFGRYVEKNCPDVKVIYTRKTDVFIPLHKRADIANKNKADVFVSIHTNAIAGRGKPTGLETYTMGMRRSDEKLSAAMRENEAVLIEQDYQTHYAGFDPRQPESYIIFELINDANMVESIELAQLIQKKVCATANRPNKGVKQDAFLVLRETSMPACLIELGYITTPSEEAYLTNSANIDALGKGIYQAFVEYKNKHTKTAAPAKEEKPAPAKEEKPAPAKEEKPAPAKEEEKTTPSKEEQIPAKEVADTDDAPVFKVQFMATSAKLKQNDPLFKGLTDVDCYQDGGVWKYTVGDSKDYNAVLALRRKVAKTFPDAFIVAFRHGERMNINEARQLFRQNQNKTK